MPSNNSKISAEQREVILHHFLHGNHELVEARTRALNLAPNYAAKLARARGILPRKGIRWGRLQEVT